MSVIPQTPRAAGGGGFAPLGPLPGLYLGPAGDVKRSPDPSPTHAPLTTNSGSAPVYMKPCVLNQTYSEKIVTQLAHIKYTESGKLRFYSKIYQQFQIQMYLSFGINKHLRSFLSKIRLSAYSLAIETGRYGRPPVPATER